MTRLPNPGSDAGQWGSILNDYLSVAHDNDGSLKQASLITGAQQTSQKGQASGYAGLDSNAKIPISQLAGIGDYIGMRSNGTAALVSGDYDNITWTSTTVVHGSSLAFDSGDPTAVQVVEAGVYAITATVSWQDVNTSASARFAQIVTDCFFLVNDQRPGFSDTVNQTIQCITTTLYLQAGHNIRITLHHDHTSDLNPQTRLLVTRCA